MLITNLKEEDEHQLGSPETHKNKRKEKENTRRSICRISKPSCLSMTLNSSYLNQTKTIKHCGLSFSTTDAPLIQLFPSGKSKKQWTCLELKSPTIKSKKKERGLSPPAAPGFESSCARLSPPRCLTCPLSLQGVQWAVGLVVVRTSWLGHPRK